AAGVVEAAGDEVARVRDEVHDIAVGRLTLDGRDGAGEDPRVAAVKRAGALRQQDDACKHKSPQRHKGHKEDTEIFIQDNSVTANAHSFFSVSFFVPFVPLWRTVFFTRRRL